MAGNFPYVLTVCILSIILVVVTITALSVYRQGASCASDPMIKCSNFTCDSDASKSSKSVFGIDSELSKVCEGDNCLNCGWTDGKNECMNNWCQSNAVTDTPGPWNTTKRCSVYTNQR